MTQFYTRRGFTTVNTAGAVLEDDLAQQLERTSPPTRARPRGDSPLPTRRAKKNIVGLLGDGPSETVIPRWYRLPGILQALAPNLVARLVARRGAMYR